MHAKVISKMVMISFMGNTSNVLPNSWYVKRCRVSDLIGIIDRTHANEGKQDIRNIIFTLPASLFNFYNPVFIQIQCLL